MRREITAGLLVCGIAYALVRLDDTGPRDGDRYEVIGRISSLGGESFTITDIQVVEVVGDASDRLGDDQEVIHDNFRDGTCVGKETSNRFDEEVDAGRLSVGSLIRVAATIGRSQTDCIAGNSGLQYEDRSLLTDLEILEP